MMCLAHIETQPKLYHNILRYRRAQMSIVCRLSPSVLLSVSPISSRAEGCSPTHSSFREARRFSLCASG
jgi:hypothetical protein